MVVNVDDPSRTVDVKYTVQPGAQFPWHSHYGPVIVNIISGSLTYVPAGTCEERTYSAGESFVDAGHGHVHTAFNPGSAPTVFIATFFEAPADRATAHSGRPWLLAKPSWPESSWSRGWNPRLGRGFRRAVSSGSSARPRRSVSLLRPAGTARRSSSPATLPLFVTLCTMSPPSSTNPCPAV